MPVSDTEQALVQYQRLAQRTQKDGRIPALSVALHRADRPLWTYEIGAEHGSRFRIGSITKSFTAVLVLQCRDDGLLDLDDPIGRHLHLTAHEELTVRRLLSHTAGLQREPYGDLWDTLDAPDVTQLLDELSRAERVLPPGRRYHYSNLGFALLGALVAKARGGTWAEVLAEKILGPLRLHSVGTSPGEHGVTGYLVDAYSDHAQPEPPLDVGAIAPAAQLWGTASDLARWAAFLTDPAALDPHGAVLRPATLEEMRWPLTTTDESLWSMGFGLGLILFPQGKRVVHIGHDGAMPGFLAATYGRRGPDQPPALAAAVLGSSGTARQIMDLPHKLLATAEQLDPPDIAPWHPGEAPPVELRSALGRWWSEGFEYVFSWREGKLRAKAAGDGPSAPASVFEPVPGEPDALRTVSGREVGELLRLTREPAGGPVTRMHWATYRFTRDQQSFEGLPAHG